MLAGLCYKPVRRRKSRSRRRRSEDQTVSPGYRGDLTAKDLVEPGPTVPVVGLREPEAIHKLDRLRSGIGAVPVADIVVVEEEIRVGLAVVFVALTL